MTTLFNKLSSNSAKHGMHRIIALDILYLLNSAIRSAALKIPKKSHISLSVLNFGNPPWISLGSSRINPTQLAIDIQMAISKFEPRLVADKVKVVARSETEKFNQKNIFFDINSLIVSSKEIFIMRLALDYQGVSFTLPGEIT